MTSNPLVNLMKIGQLEAVPFSQPLLDKLLATATSRLADAQRADNSTETRFDCAYTAIRAVADAALTECICQAQTLLEIAKQRLQ